MNEQLDYLRELFPAACRDRVVLVGGWVRDLLQGRANRDIDLAAALTGDELAGCGFRLVTGKSTAPIWFRHDDMLGVIELTPLADLRALEADLARRDFTINALAMDLEGNLHDPLGGRDDLARGMLRPCSAQSFRDDPARIFRALRFEAYGWRMTAECRELIREREWSRELASIPVERFSREMLKACALPRGERFFRGMLEFGVGTAFLPELFRMPAIPAGPLCRHPEGDLLTHSLQVLERVAEHSADPLARFCAFFHDIGKLATAPDRYPRHHGHERAGIDLARLLCLRLRLPTRYRTALAGVSRLHMLLARWDELRDGTKVRVAEQAHRAGIGEIIPMVGTADTGSDGEPAGWPRALEVVRMSTSALNLDQRHLEKVPPEGRCRLIHMRRVEVFRGTATRPSCA